MDKKMKTIKTNAIITELTDDTHLIVSQHLKFLHLDFRMNMFSSGDLTDIFDIREDDCEPTFIKLTLTPEAAEAIATTLLKYKEVNDLRLARINKNKEKSNGG
tara:strand:- start:3165 stop:3473 length:309 start_codon:yes stop_codon:yes gene_type:complete